MKLLIGITGSVATIKINSLLLELQLKIPCLETKLVATKNALHFMDHHHLKNFKLYQDEEEWNNWEKMGDPICHIELRNWADGFLIAPLDANTLAKISHGLCDNLLTCIVRAWDHKKPLWVCPAMNTYMWDNCLTSLQLTTIQSMLGYKVIFPVSKNLACGDTGMGGMASVNDITAAIIEWRIETVSRNNDHDDDLTAVKTTKAQPFALFDVPLAVQRYEYVSKAVIETSCIKIVDLGCGSLSLLKHILYHLLWNEDELIPLNSNRKINYIGIDQSQDYLEDGQRVLEREFGFYNGKLKSTVTIDVIKENFSQTIGNWMVSFQPEMITLIEVIEHLDPRDLEMLPELLFHPQLTSLKELIITTPNCEFNPFIIGLSGYRHWDHRFEWSRKEFTTWCIEAMNRNASFALEDDKDLDWIILMDGVGYLSHIDKDISGPCSQIARFIKARPLLSFKMNEIHIEKNFSMTFLSVKENETRSETISRRLIEFILSHFENNTKFDEKNALEIDYVWNNDKTIQSFFTNSTEKLLDYIIRSKEFDITLDEKSYFLSKYYYSHLHFC